MYLNQLQNNQNELSLFYSLLRIMALSENISSVDLLQQNENTHLLRKFSDYQLRLINKDLEKMRKAFNSLVEPKIVGKVINIFTSGEGNKEEHEEVNLELSQSEINHALIHFYKNILTNKEYKKFSDIVLETSNYPIPEISAINETNQWLESSINAVFEFYKNDAEFINNKILEGIRENKINALTFDKGKIKEFLLSLSDIKHEIITELVNNVNKLDSFNSLNLLTKQQKKIFIFNLQLVFSSKEKLSEYSNSILKAICQAMELDIEYLDELWDAAKNLSTALDYADELIYE